MWLATQHGFYSIVQTTTELYFVCARFRADLEGLVDLFELETDILEADGADYRYRIAIDLETLLEVMVQLTADVDYPDFRARIYEREEQSYKLGAYQEMWATLSELGEGPIPVG